MASYPTSAKTFTTKSNGQTIQPAHINDLQDEVTAIETDLIAGLPVTRGGIGQTTGGTAGQTLTSGGASAATVWVNTVVDQQNGILAAQVFS